MKRLTAIALLAFVAAPLTAAEVGRSLNWQTPGNPNYTPAELPGSREEPAQYRLPDVPEAPSGSTALSQAMRVQVTSIVVHGVTALPEADVQSLTSRYIGREISAGELQALRLELSKLYLSRGFVNSGVVIPDQDVSEGVIHLQAIEGALTEVAIAGDPHLSGHFIKSRIDRYVDAPLDVNALQDALRHLQQNAQVSRLDARLAPGSELGQAVLHVQVYEPERFDVGLSADNHGSSSVGAERVRLAASMRNLTGWGEQLSVGGSLTDGANDYFASFAVPLTRFDTTLQASYTRSDSKIIEDAFKDLDIKSQTDSWGVFLSQPVYDDLVTKVVVSGGLEVKHSETELLGIPFSFSPGAQDGEADTTVAQLGVDLTRRGDDSVLALRTTYRRGLDALNATIIDRNAPDATFNPTGADGEFDLVFAQALFLQRLNALPVLTALPDRAQLVVRSTVQYSFDPLMSLEKIAMGGVNTVRGYRENLLVRDNGAALSVEAQLPFFGYHNEPHPLNIVVAPFVDLGYSWDDVDNDPTSNVRDTDQKRGILGVGLGVLWRPHEWVQAQLYWGADVWDSFDRDDPRDSGTRNQDLQDDGVHFNVSVGGRF